MANTQRPNEGPREYVVRRSIENGYIQMVNGVALMNEKMLVDLLDRYDTSIPNY
jgi:hypothetical protein